MVRWWNYIQPHLQKQYGVGWCQISFVFFNFNLSLYVWIHDLFSDVLFVNHAKVDGKGVSNSFN